MNTLLENGMTGCTTKRLETSIGFRDGSTRGRMFSAYGGDWIAFEIAPDRIALFESGKHVANLRCTLDDDRIMREYFSVLGD